MESKIVPFEQLSEYHKGVITKGIGYNGESYVCPDGSNLRIVEGGYEVTGGEPDAASVAPEQTPALRAVADGLSTPPQDDLNKPMPGMAVPQVDVPVSHETPAEEVSAEIVEPLGSVSQETTQPTEEVQNGGGDVSQSA